MRPKTSAKKRLKSRPSKGQERLIDLTNPRYREVMAMGGMNRVAKILGVTRMAVWYWIEKGFPKVYANGPAYALLMRQPLDRYVSIPADVQARIKEAHANMA